MTHHRSVRTRLDELFDGALTPTVRIGDCVVLGAIERRSAGPVALGLWVRGAGRPSPVVIHRARALEGEFSAAEEMFFAAGAAAGTAGAYAYDAGVVDLDGERSFVWLEELIEGVDVLELIATSGVPRPGYEVGVRLALMRRVLAAVPAGYAYDALVITPTTVVVTWGGAVRLLPRMDIRRERRVPSTRSDQDLKRWPPITPETAAGRARAPGLPARQRVFQVGAVLAWIATGADPFASGSELERLERILRGDARVEGGAVLERHPRIAELLLACLAADPRDRPDTLAVVARDLAMATGAWSPGDLLGVSRSDAEDPWVIASRIREQMMERHLARERAYRRIAREEAPDAPPMPFVRTDLAAVAARAPILAPT